MDEVWKDIPGYEGLYQVSNFGNVKSEPRASTKGGLLKPHIDRKGYIVFILCKDGKIKCHKAHRLVAKAFIQNPFGFPEVNHKDEQKANNCVDNLEWCSGKYNANYGSRTEKIKKKLLYTRYSPVFQCDLNGNSIRFFESITEAALAVKDISAVSTISKCCRGKRKTAYGYIWKYK